LVIAGLVGCASSSELEEKSRVHSLKADAAAQQRNYAKAAKEQQEAQELHAKAVERAYKEGTANQLVVPSDLPAPPNP
jgi:hypothetical protein